MDTTSTTASAALDRTPPRTAILPAAGVGALAATAANVALWLGGRAAGAGFEVTAGADGQTMQVGVALVALATLLSFALGTGLLATAARRSRLWVRIVVAVGAVFAVATAASPLSAGQDTATGALLAAMHLAAGAAFVATAAWILRSQRAR